MSLKINIDNYEEIMFRLVEDDFDEPTRAALLQQIESDTLLKFEWESWQKTKFAEPLENYSDESRKLEEKILLIAENQTTSRKSLFYWAAAATIIFLIASLFLLTSEFKSRPEQEVVEIVKELPAPLETATPPVQNQPEPIDNIHQQQFRNQKSENIILQVSDDSSTIVPVGNTLAEIPLLLDSVQVKTNELAKAPEKKPRYTITIETSDISVADQQNYVMAQTERVKISKLFTNTKMFLRRKPNGEPDRLILIGDENSYVCLNLNY